MSRRSACFLSVWGPMQCDPLGFLLVLLVVALVTIATVSWLVTSIRRRDE